MKLRIIFIASESAAFIDAQRQQRIAYAGPETEIEIACLSGGPEVLESAYDEVMVGPHLIQAVEEANSTDCDAVVIDCVGDPNLHAAREIAQIPVIGAGEAAFSLALTLGRTFSIIAPSDSVVPMLVRNLRAYGYWDRVGRIRSASVPITDLGVSPVATERILMQARQLLEKDGTEVLVLGCTGMAPLAEELHQQLGIPVVEPAAAAIKLAETVVSLKAHLGRG